MKLLRFRLAGRPFALDVADVREVARMVIVTPLAGAPPEILGVIDVHGQIVPVLDGRQRMGLAARAVTPDSPLIIMADGLALLVDQVDGVIDVPNGGLAAGADWAATRGLVALDGEITAVLDSAALPTPAVQGLLAGSDRKLRQRAEIG